MTDQERHPRPKWEEIGRQIDAVETTTRAGRELLESHDVGAFFRFEVDTKRLTTQAQKDAARAIADHMTRQFREIAPQVIEQALGEIEQAAMNQMAAIAARFPALNPGGTNGATKGRSGSGRG